MINSVTAPDEMIDYPTRDENVGRTVKIFNIDGRKGIRGICFLLEKGQAEDEFCPVVEIVLKDFQGNVLSSTETDNSGRFHFYKIPNREFSLDVQSFKYRKRSDKIIVGPGSEVFIYLLPK
tara:strand:- start:188680 stop:189042 length:363 start_codon:yes stop_codon:yes gene_type:complete